MLHTIVFRVLYCNILCLTQWKNQQFYKDDSNGDIRYNKFELRVFLSVGSSIGRKLSYSLAYPLNFVCMGIVNKTYMYFIEQKIPCFTWKIDMRFMPRQNFRSNI